MYLQHSLKARVYVVCVCVCVCRMGYVTFSTVESAKLALEASEDQLTLDGRQATLYQHCLVYTALITAF